MIGPERPPCLADRKFMPYTDAVLYEIQRFITILPMGLPRAVTRDTPFREFLLPKVPSPHLHAAEQPSQ